MKKEPNLTIIILTTIFCSFFLTTVAFASNFLVELPKEEGTSPYVANIYLVPGGETLNAVEGIVVLGQGFSPAEIRSGNSNISLWVESPHYDKSRGEIIFSGIIPNGFSGGRAFLFSLVLNSRLPVVVGGTAYRNDGEGSQIRLSKSSTKTIRGEEVKYLSFDLDKEPPEDFSPVISKESAFGDDKLAIFFITQDKFSGIDHYEIFEAEPQLLFFEPRNPTFRVALSPHILSDQDRRSFVYIKAVDKNKNERVVRIPPEVGLYTYRNGLAWFIMIIVFLATVYLLNRRKV